MSRWWSHLFRGPLTRVFFQAVPRCRFFPREPRGSPLLMSHPFCPPTISSLFPAAVFFLYFYLLRSRHLSLFISTLICPSFDLLTFTHPFVVSLMASLICFWLFVTSLPSIHIFNTFFFHRKCSSALKSVGKSWSFGQKWMTCGEDQK